MANFVIKKDSTRVPFDVAKIKSAVMSAASEAELDDDKASSLAEEISSSVATSFEGQEEVSSSELREKILSELDASAPTVGESWRKYDESKGV